VNLNPIVLLQAAAATTNVVKASQQGALPSREMRAPDLSVGFNRRQRIVDFLRSLVTHYYQLIFGDFPWPQQKNSK